jgi:type IV pilus assembly protein PilW
MVKRPLAPDSRDRGLTLIEVVVTLGLLSVVVLIITTILITSGKTHRRTMGQAEVQAASRQTLALLTTEIRQAGADPRNPPMGLQGVVTADSVTLRVRADLNGDGAIQTTEPSEDVTYAYDAGSGTLSRDPGSGAASLLTDVTSFRISYFNAADQPLTTFPLSATDCSLVHSVGVSMTCQGRDTQPFTLATRITLRNQ